MATTRRQQLTPPQSHAQVIGMDEAGYGPNLGPLVICLTHWHIPGADPSIDLYSLLDDVVSSTGDVVSSTGTDSGGKLHVADSKQVHSSSHGIGPLERSALGLLRVAGMPVSSWRELLLLVTGTAPDNVPWYIDEDLTLPIAANQSEIEQCAQLLQEAMRSHGVQLTTIRGRVLEPGGFNRLLEENCGKGELLSRAAFRLLRTVWEDVSGPPTLVIGDKHGGRNRYDLLLSEVLDGEMIFRLEEGRELSRYRVGDTELRFQTKGEQHLPVAAASIIAKYLRELCMELFNRFWVDQIPGLKPTKGYPEDARRFRAATAPCREQLGISDRDFWRTK